MWEYLFDVKWKKIPKTVINWQIWPHGLTIFDHTVITNYVSLMMLPDVVKQPSQNLHLWGLVPEKKENKITILFVFTKKR